MNKVEPIHVPFTKAGQAAFDVIYEIALKVHTTAVNQTNDFIEAKFPKSKTVATYHENGKYYRTLHSKGTVCTLTYNYRTKEIEIL